MQWGGECWSSRVSLPSFESQLGYLVALELWAGNLSFQSLSFVIYKMQMIMVTMSSDDACKVLSAMPGRYLEHRKCYLSLLLLFLLLLLLSGSSEREHLS